MSVLAFAQPQASTEAPTSAPALKAVSNYTIAVNKLDEDYSRRLFALRQQYMKELDAARKIALEKDDLDEAQRLLAEKKRVEVETVQPGVSKGLAILSAVYGTDDQWLDITPRVRSAVKNGQFHYPSGWWNDLPDVAPGRHKSMMIAYTLNGKVFVSITLDNQPIDLPKQ